MASFLIKILLSFLTPANISSIMAKCIANLLNHASKKGGKTWDKTKEIINQTENWIGLYNQVYDDEDISREDEGKIAKAIELSTPISKIIDLIKK